eukprot:GHVU01007460.1.p2 GENE.GHVU01007460.1~~GHVU01007460.1.p2  ORF type:complete len:128 (+),score=13.40 GHVU01007460.1:1217-1600(+)
MHATRMNAGMQARVYVCAAAASICSSRPSTTTTAVAPTWVGSRPTLTDSFVSMRVSDEMNSMNRHPHAFDLHQQSEVSVLMSAAVQETQRPETTTGAAAIAHRRCLYIYIIYPFIYPHVQPSKQASK